MESLSRIKDVLGNMSRKAKLTVATAAGALLLTFLPTTQTQAQCDICPGNKESPFKLYIRPQIGGGQVSRVKDISNSQVFVKKDLSQDDPNTCSDCDTHNRSLQAGIFSGLQIGSDEGPFAVHGGLGVNHQQEHYGIAFNQYDITRTNLDREAGLRMKGLNVEYSRTLTNLFGSSNRHDPWNNTNNKVNDPHGSETFYIGFGKNLQIGGYMTNTKNYNVPFPANTTTPLQPFNNRSFGARLSYTF